MADLQNNTGINTGTAGPALRAPVGARSLGPEIIGVDQSFKDGLNRESVQRDFGTGMEIRGQTEVLRIGRRLIPVNPDTSSIEFSGKKDNLVIDIINKPQNGQSSVSRITVKPDGSSTGPVSGISQIGNRVPLRMENLGDATLQKYGVSVGCDENGEPVINLKRGTVSLNDGKNDRAEMFVDDLTGNLVLTAINKMENGKVLAQNLNILPGGGIIPPRGHYPFTSTENVSDTSPANVKNIFEKGFENAQGYARKLGYELEYEASGIRARGIGASPEGISPIEVQTILLKDPRTGQKTKIGGILPEKYHLGDLKSSREIAAEICAMIDKHLGKAPE